MIEPLSFEEPLIKIPMRLRSFYGQIIEQMPLLLTGTDASGNVVDVPRTLMTPKQLLYERVHGTPEHDRALLQDNDAHTACAVIGDPNKTGGILIGLYTDPVVQTLIDALNPESTLAHNALPVTNDHYQTIRRHAFAIPQTVVRNLIKDPYSEVSTREALWEHITEGDRYLVKDTLALVQDKTSGGTMNDRMGFWPPNTPGLRLLEILPIGDHESDASSNEDLNNSNSCLIGVAPRQRDLEQRIIHSLSN